MPMMKRNWNDTGCLGKPYIVLVLLVLFVTSQCMGVSARDYLTNSNAAVKNVTCIAHDSQFTCDCGMVDQVSYGNSLQ